ncbi:MAG: nitronate monooxygenase [Alphaproteobacteria bacterium]|nr:MAG: nitronate monooxygenase [Alphaproteobacteria bacterium]
MSLPEELRSRLKLPVVAAPMFLVSGPQLVIAACRAGVLGTFPALNARPIEELDRWLKEISAALGDQDAPFGVNLIVHRSNTRLAEDVEMVVRHRVPVVITSVGHPGDIVEKVHAYGGIVWHDVTNLHHARKAMASGVDGLILVSAGAGGHAGTINPFALVPQVREFFAGTILLAGAISDGRAVRAAEVLGADLAWLGTRFIATRESLADPQYKQMLVEAQAADIVYTDKVSGIHGNFIRQSLEAAGIEWRAAGERKKVDMDLASRAAGEKEASAAEREAKAWKHIWSAGQGVGSIHDIPTVAELVERLEAEYRRACDLPPFHGASGAPHAH